MGDLRALTRYDEDYASIHPNGVLVNSNGNIHDVKGNIVSDDPDKSSEEDASRIMLGASVRGMSKVEKEAEKLRWENEVLGKVPEQPSFNELGMENQVFELDTRRSNANAIAAAAAVVAATTARRDIEERKRKIEIEIMIKKEENMKKIKKKKKKKKKKK